MVTVANGHDADDTWGRPSPTQTASPARDTPAHRPARRRTTDGRSEPIDLIPLQPQHRLQLPVLALNRLQARRRLRRLRCCRRRLVGGCLGLPGAAACAPCRCNLDYLGGGGGVGGGAGELSTLYA